MWDNLLKKINLFDGSLIQLFDTGSDMHTIWIYVSVHRYYMVGALISVLLLYMTVSAVLGIRMLQKENQTYSTLWNGHWVIRALTILSHCLGLGLVPLSIDLAIEIWRERFGENVINHRLVKKTKNYASLALLHIFLGKLDLWKGCKAWFRIFSVIGN